MTHKSVLTNCINPGSLQHVVQSLHNTALPD